MLGWFNACRGAVHSSSNLLRCVYYLRFVKNRVYFTFITLSSKSLTFNWIFLVRVFGFVATMPCCVVPGCTSGYGSNPERVYFLQFQMFRNVKKFGKTSKFLCNNSNFMQVIAEFM